MRQAKNPEEAVRSRLRSILTDDSVRDQEPDDRRRPVAPTGPGRPAWPTGDEGPLTWSDLIPSWPDDLNPTDGDPDPPPSPPSASGGQAADSSRPSAAVGPLVTSSSSSGFGARSVFIPGLAAPPVDRDGGAWARGDGSDYSWEFEGSDGEPMDSQVDEHSESSARRIGAGAFDPGRRGVKALAAVAVVVVAIAGFFAWRARPQVDPVPPIAPVPAAADGVAGGDAAKPTATGEVVIAVAGKVKKPGLVRLPSGSRVADALQAAGGADPGVDVSLLNLARKVVDGELILVGVTPPPGSTVAAGPAGSGTAQGPINLNTATLADLDTLPGVGPVLAQRILDARDAQGGFRSVSDLRKVDGIGDSRYEQLKDLVTV